MLFVSITHPVNILPEKGFLLQHGSLYAKKEPTHKECESALLWWILRKNFYEHLFFCYQPFFAEPQLQQKLPVLLVPQFGQFHEADAFCHC